MSDWGRYVPVAERRTKARRAMARRLKKGEAVQPVVIEGRKIARTFWGIAWCEHLLKFSDYANRLPRGATYARNGSVCHLAVEPGAITAFVSGSALYKVTVQIKPLGKQRWNKLKSSCKGNVGSLIELLEGRLSDQVMSTVTHKSEGLFPQPREIEMDCTCPDWAGMCKHIAAVLYGVGARLDHAPELLFSLRGVDHDELIASDVDTATSVSKVIDGHPTGTPRLPESALGDIFGIALDLSPPPALKKTRTKKKNTAKRKKASRSPSMRTDTPWTGPLVQRLREENGLTEHALAVELGINDVTVAAWERTPGPLRLHPSHRAKLDRWLKYLEDGELD